MCNLSIDNVQRYMRGRLTSARGRIIICCAESGAWADQGAVSFLLRHTLACGEYIVGLPRRARRLFKNTAKNTCAFVA